MPAPITTTSASSDRAGPLSQRSSPDEKYGPVGAVVAWLVRRPYQHTPPPRPRTLNTFVLLRRERVSSRRSRPLPRRSRRARALQAPLPIGRTRRARSSRRTAPSSSAIAWSRCSGPCSAPCRRWRCARACSSAGAGAEVPQVAGAHPQPAQPRPHRRAVVRDTCGRCCGPGAGLARRLADLVALVHGKKAELRSSATSCWSCARSRDGGARRDRDTRGPSRNPRAPRVPQLARLLELLEPLWQRRRASRCRSRRRSRRRRAAGRLAAGRGHAARAGAGGGVSSRRGARGAGEACWSTRDGKPLLASASARCSCAAPSPEAARGGLRARRRHQARARSTWRSRRWRSTGEADGVGRCSTRALRTRRGRRATGRSGGVERPFRGLASFGPEHAALFFGREEQAETLANRIRRDAFVTVTGPSGSGKTSLLRARRAAAVPDHAVVARAPGREAARKPRRAARRGDQRTLSAKTSCSRSSMAERRLARRLLARWSARSSRAGSESASTQSAGSQGLRTRASLRRRSS